MGKPRRGDRIEVALSGLDEKGNGLGHWDDYTVRVRGGLPGDRVQGLIWKVQHRRRQIDARKEALLSTEIDRQPARCVHFGRCGGCLWQDVPYGEQVRLKQGMVQASLEASGIGVVLDAPLAAESPFYYRNKMEFSFGASPAGDLELGLHVPGRFDRVFDLEACHLQSEQSNGIVSRVRAFAQRHALRPYHLKRHDGLLRFLTVREGKQTGETMVVLTTSDEAFPGAEAFAEDLRTTFPEITCVVHSVNRRKAQVAIGDDEQPLVGAGQIRERLGDFSFDISPSSFFQTNTRQAERLYRRVVDLAAPGKGDRVLDVYCGAGGISLFLAKQARSVLGIEVVASAVEDAVRNSARNGVTNCAFLSGPAEDLLDQLRLQSEYFEVAVVDPPRAGMHARALSALMALRPPRIVYVSCNPQALGRDLAAMQQAGYRADYAQLVDMFPHTPHCEVLVHLAAGA